MKLKYTLHKRIHLITYYQTSGAHSFKVYKIYSLQCGKIYCISVYMDNQTIYY